MDPAVLGTARIGLDGIRREHDHYDRGDPVHHGPRPRRRPVRHHLAEALRRLAARLEPASQPAA